MNKLLQQLNKIGAEPDDAIERFVNDKELYLKCVTSFLNDSTIELLTHAVEDENYDEAEKAVHSLKGIVSSLGFTPLTNACVDMLEELKDKNISDALEAYKEIQSQYSIYYKVIKSNIESLI